MAAAKARRSIWTNVYLHNMVRRFTAICYVYYYYYYYYCYKNRTVVLNKKELKTLSLSSTYKINNKIQLIRAQQLQRLTILTNLNKLQYNAHSRHNRVRQTNIHNLCGGVNTRVPDSVLDFSSKRIG